MNKSLKIRRPKPSEEGYLLVSVMFMLALLMIALAIAAPKIAKQIQRDRELETMHRGKQYARAVKLYYKKFGAYPASVDALVNTNQIRFLRKKYIDPTTGKDEWKPIHLGQNKAPTAMGFFGVPLNGAGAGGGLCGNALPSSTPSSSSSFGSSGSSSGSFGSSSGSSGSSFGTTSPLAGCPSTDSTGSSSSSSTDPNTAANGATDPNAAGGNSGSQSANGSSGTTPGSGTGSTSSIGQTGQTFGGAGIMGFSPQSPKQSILVYKKKNHYNEWEFVYDPMADQMMMQGGNTGALGAGTGTGGIGGGGIGGSGIGGGIGSGGAGGGSTLGGGSGTSSGSGSSNTTPPQQ
jgi:type II secretory pathway pseudopilin PulG